MPSMSWIGASHRLRDPAADDSVQVGRDRAVGWTGSRDSIIQAHGWHSRVGASCHVARGEAAPSDAGTRDATALRPVSLDYSRL